MEGKAARHWRGFALGLIFLALGAVPAVFLGWQTTSSVFVAGGLVIAIGELAWIVWSRRRVLRGTGEGPAPDDENSL